MALSRDTRNERKMKAVMRAEFGLKQRIDRIDWEEDVLLPRLLEYQGKAQLPELPSETIVTVEFVPDEPKKPRAPRKGK